jgi:hypothetical protein
MGNEHSRLRAEPPQSLHRFRRAISELDGRSRELEVERAQEVLVTHKLFHANPLTFNDAFDCRPYWSGGFTPADAILVRTQDARRRLPGASAASRHEMGDLAVRRAAMPESRERAWEALVDRWRICCLVDGCTSTAMWGLYGEAHRGYCLEFTITAEDWEAGFVPIQVEYTHTRPNLTISAMRNAGRTIGSDDSFIRSCIATKSNDWSFEREWRLHRDAGPDLVPFRAGMLTGITLGANMPPGDRARLCALALKSSSDICVYEARRSRQHYSVERSKLDSKQIVALASEAEGDSPCR